MKHTIRRNEQFEHIDCELGTEIYDVNGNEIVEGDFLKSPTGGGFVYFHRGCFWLVDDRLADLDEETLEIVGHMRDFK